MTLPDSIPGRGTHAFHRGFSRLDASHSGDRRAIAVTSGEVVHDAVFA